MHELDTTDSKLGVHYALLNIARETSGAEVQFTFYWPEADKWEGRNFSVAII
jgi:glucoamylase